MVKKSHWVHFLTLVAVIAMMIPGATEAQKPTSDNQIDIILADGQFVYGPNVGDFDTAAFLRSIDSPLLPYATVLEDKASYYSINPRVLLTILEIQSGLVTGQQLVASLERVVGYDDVVGFDEQVEALTKIMTIAFYDRLYGEPASADAGLPLTLSAGDKIEVPANTNAGTLAVLVALAPLSSNAEWEALISAKDAQGFVQTYRHLFPESDPLDTSNQILSPTAPPSNLLKFPFACGDTWNFSGGPHDWDGNCVDDPWSALDFAPGVANCAIPTNRWITSPAAGTVSDVSCGGCQVYINHSGGWSTRFFHVANTQVSEGQYVAQDQPIGNPSCKPAQGGSCGGCPGSATGTHVHYDLRYNGAFYPIDGTSLEGWVVHATSCSDGYNGYLQKGSQQIWRGSPVTSACPDIIPPTTSYTLSGTAGENGWYRSSVQVTLTATDNSGGSGVKLIQYQIDGGSWQTYSSPFTVSGEGSHIVRYKAQDNAGNWESEKQVAIRIDATAPTGSLTLNNGATTTPGVLVQASPSASDATSGLYQMRLRDAGGSWSEWLAYATSTLWQLPAVTGQTYAVEIQFKDWAGNLSPIYSRSITLNIYPARPASSGYRLARSTWGAAPWDRQSANYRLRGTVGQPSMIGILSSANYRLRSGYWAFPLFERKVYLPLVLRQSP